MSDSEEENSQGGPLAQYTQTEITAMVKENRCSRAALGKIMPAYEVTKDCAMCNKAFGAEIVESDAVGLASDQQDWCRQLVGTTRKTMVLCQKGRNFKRGDARRQTNEWKSACLGCNVCAGEECTKHIGPELKCLCCQVPSKGYTRNEAAKGIEAVEIPAITNLLQGVHDGKIEMDSDAIADAAESGVVARAGVKEQRIAWMADAVEKGWFSYPADRSTDWAIFKERKDAISKEMYEARGDRWFKFSDGKHAFNVIADVDRFLEAKLRRAPIVAARAREMEEARALEADPYDGEDDYTAFSAWAKDRAERRAVAAAEEAEAAREAQRAAEQQAATLRQAASVHPSPMPLAAAAGGGGGGDDDDEPENASEVAGAAMAAMMAGIGSGGARSARAPPAAAAGAPRAVIDIAAIVGGAATALGLGTPAPAAAGGGGGAPPALARLGIMGDKQANKDARSYGYHNLEQARIAASNGEENADKAVEYFEKKGSSGQGVRDKKVVALKPARISAKRFYRRFRQDPPAGLFFKSGGKKADRGRRGMGNGCYIREADLIANAGQIFDDVEALVDAKDAQIEALKEHIFKHLIDPNLPGSSTTTGALKRKAIEGYFYGEAGENSDDEGEAGQVSDFEDDRDSDSDEEDDTSDDEDYYTVDVPKKQRVAAELASVDEE